MTELSLSLHHPSSLIPQPSQPSTHYTIIHHPSSFSHHPSIISPPPMPKHRILYIDILKLFTIYLVIWGHAIMHFQPNYGDSTIFQLIYSFHMPLFMMLSGYFAVSSMELDVKTFFVKKFRQLLLPCISWGIVCWFTITSGLIYGEFNLQVKKLFRVVINVLMKVKRFRPQAVCSLST